MIKKTTQSCLNKISSYIGIYKEMSYHAKKYLEILCELESFINSIMKDLELFDKGKDVIYSDKSDKKIVEKVIIEKINVELMTILNSSEKNINKCKVKDILLLIGGIV